MKRCPKCEFIYEDDQGLCDMDGALLVLDSRTLPNLQASGPLPRIPKRNRAVPAFATLILLLVLGMIYYVSIQRKAQAPTNVTSIANPAPAAAAEPVPITNPTLKAEPSIEAPPTKQPTAAPVKRPTAKALSTSQTKPTTAPKKEDSKVNSILKKTGRILKKPFKF